MNILAALLAAACLAAPVFAQDPAVTPPVAPPAAESAVKLSFSTATAIALGRPTTSVRYFVAGDIQGPLVIGTKAVGDLGGGASIETLPAKSEDGTTGALTDLAQWGNVLQINGFVGRRIGDAKFGDQHVSTSIVVDGGIATAFFDSAAEPQRKRFYRSYGIGVQTTLHLPDRDAFFRLGWGRDEAVGERGYGQIRLAAELPAIKGVRIYGRAGLGIGAAKVGAPGVPAFDQTDYVIVGLGKPW